MPNETVQLARYAAGLKYEDLPPAAVVHAKDIIADTVAACICGADMLRKERGRALYPADAEGCVQNTGWANAGRDRAPR